MPTPLHCLAWFSSDDGFGWTEAHWILGPDGTFDLLPFTLAFDDLMTNFRRPLLGNDRVLEGVRVSYSTVAGARVSSPLWYAPPKGPANNKDGTPPELAAKLRMRESTNQHFGDTYLRGFWDSVEKNERLDFTTPDGVAWKNLLDGYINVLAGRQYGFMRTNPQQTRRGQIINYTINPDGFCVFSLMAGSGPALPAVGTVLPFRAARINNSKSPLNETHTVKVTGVSEVTTVLPTAAGPFVSAGTFTINSTTFSQYTGSQYIKLARRKPGRPFGRSPGRLKAKARS